MDWMKNGFGIKIYPNDYKKAQLPKGPAPLLGDFNELNLKGAVTLCRALGVSEKMIEKGMRKIRPVPGRFENIPNKKNLKVIVDYAHTPDGLQNVLSTCVRMRHGSGGKLITVFGCGGDRDRGKRPKMAAVVEKLSDYFIVTSDNPRTEKPAQIFNDIQKGIRGKKEYEVIEDRRHAIEKAIRAAKQHDIVLLAGKGHETYQIIGKKRIHFDDREEARKILNKALKNA
jgi:UDP-N-acetylmuramoyl-L-alanyl-D-glutamate--2,6-diaminopimelate ligase